ncbi:flavodoxin domain-containing protein [Ramlibacter tataouinensis]|uniref:flavodoxin domain-containing protein n=1 Tax=Ramlibacter tataouinensis TaxID=94132 RepID=UPI0022F3E01D|nr:flavodoxin domain-containing protein [Ramlibacter tataouinensis]WBY03006.1 flavodoxin domain-containing protein [Ramlibacter tataouinensis]
MQRRLSVLVASSNGMAWRICGFACEFLRTEFADIEMLDAGSTPATALAQRGRFLLVVSSTFGRGELPRAAQPLQASLRERRVDLSGIVFGVVCLGDRSFRETFCGAAARWKELLGFGGARFAGPELKLDMCERRIELPRLHAWSRAWLASLGRTSLAE